MVIGAHAVGAHTTACDRAVWTILRHARPRSPACVAIAYRGVERINTVLAKQQGLLAKTWLSGVGTNTAGGLYAFDSIENAQAFALDYFPSVAARMKAAFYTRLFDARIVADASRDIGSPFYA